MGPNLATFGDRNRVAGFMDHTEEETSELDYGSRREQTRKLNDSYDTMY